MDRQAKAILQQQRAERDEFGRTLMKALRENMPWGLTVDLGHDQKAELTTMNGNPNASQPERQPILPEGAPLTAGSVEPIGYEEWSFTFDWRLENCDQDHIEMTVKISGGGGMV